MNRSILIVMCDFVVISMLSMITGVSTLENPYGADGTVVNSRTAQVIVERLRNERQMLEEVLQELKLAQEKFGFSQAREDAMKKLTGQIARTDLELELLEKGDITEAAAGPAEEKLAHNRLQSRYNQAMRKLTLEDGSRAGGELNLFTADSGGGADFGGGAAGVERERWNSGELRKIKELLAEREVELEHTLSELQDKEAELTRTVRQREQAALRIKSFEDNIATLQKEMEQADEKLEFSRNQLLLTKRNIVAKEEEIARNRQQLTGLQEVLKRAVGDISQSRAALQSAKAETKVVELELLAARRDIDKLKDNFASPVLFEYADAMVRLDVSMRQKRFFGDYRNQASYYLPLVKFDGGTAVISLFRFLSGNSLNKMELDQLEELDFRYVGTSVTDKVTEPSKYDGHLTVVRKDVRVALLELPEATLAGVRPVELLTRSGLKKRGLNELYLFKNTDFGKNGGTLEGRCSLSLDPNDGYLYIRNGNRGEGGAYAEPGDFVMTREGRYVGVVVALQGKNGGEARCFVFPDDFFVRDSIRIPGGDYAEFNRIGATLVDKLKLLEQNK